MKYSVRIEKDGVFYAYLQHHNKTMWCKKTAKKHALYMISQGYDAFLEPEY